MRLNHLSAFFLLALSACATSPTGRSQLTLMPDSQMNEMGGAAFKQTQEETPKETDPKLNDYVRCVALAVTAEVRDPKAATQWDVVLFKSDAVNAFALPGGHIGVYTGLLKAARTPDQLAAVLGHEVAHVLARHGNERMSQQVATQEALVLIGALSGAQGDAKKQQMMALLGLGAQVGVLLPFSRVQESEADRIGIEIMARAGFDPRASIALWRNMGAAGGDGPPQFLSTHPSHSTRIKDLQGRMSKAVPLYEQARASGKQPHCSL